MAVSAIWIRDNMLSFQDQHDRQLTEAELKVQRSLQKLSIPDWYLNKRSNPPKILSNVTPIESRPCSWKNQTYKKNTSTMSSTTSHTDTYTLESRASTDICDNANTGTYKVTRQPKLEYSPRKSPSKKSSSKNEVFDTTIPKVKLPKNISKTFPKVSPSRKIQNINIFFPPGPAIEISNVLENELEFGDSKYTTFVVKKQSEKPKPTKHLEDPTESQCKTPTKTSYVTRFQSEIFETSFETPNVKVGFNVRAVSTPKCKPVNLFSSTVIEDTPTTKKYLSQSYIEPIIIDDTINSKLTDHSFLENSMCDDSEFNARKVRPNFIMEERIRSIDPILFEKDDSAFLTSPKKGPSSVRDIVRKLDSQNQFNQDVLPSPCTRFLYTKKKSTELENIVKSKQPTRGKGLVKGIIEELNEKCKSTLTRQNRVAVNPENFVKKLVNALEKGDNSEVNEILLSRRKHTDEEDTESCSESEKSAVSSASISLKDTDSSSDSDQRSPSLKSDEDRFEYEDLVTSQISESEARINEEDDSVYWIPVSKCKLPRTSSLLSMMSRLSMQHSPCVSPIRSDDGDHTIHASWGVTFKKTGSSSRKLFRIDETAITDSGYSDKSDRSGANSSSGTSTIDGTWSEDTQNESESESKSSRFKKLTPRRKTIVGYRTFVV